MARACSICGSRRWRKDKVTGNAICEEGHVYQDFRSENLVVEGFNFHVQKRTLKKGLRGNKRRDQGRANPQYYHGSDAEYLRIQATTLLLRYQVQALSRLWNLPNAFEIIIRDLWAYQLAISPLPLLPDPANPIQEDTPPLEVQSESGAGPLLDVEMADNKSSSSDSEAEDEKHDDREDFIDDDLIQELEDGSDKEENLREMSPIDESGGVKTNMNWRRRRKLRTSDTLVTIIVGLWLLRVPFINTDIESAANESKIPYIDFGRTTLVSDKMRRHMNRDVIRVLSPSRAPNSLTLHSSARSFAKILHRHFGLQIPEANIHPITWRIIASLGGTPTTYTQTIRLLDLLNINISLVERETALLSRTRRGGTKARTNENGTTDDSEPEIGKESYQRTKLYQDVQAPELSVVAVWIIVMKMIYGLDDIPRQVLLKADPAIGNPTKKIWIEELKSRLQSGVLRGDRAMLVKQDFTRMPEDELDAFLIKCEDVLLKDRSDLPDSAPLPLFSHDPLSDPPIHPNSWRNFHSNAPTLIHEPLSPEISEKGNKSLPLMSGEKVKSFDSEDVTGILPEEYEIVLRSAAEVVGIEMRDVGRVVRRFERRLEKMRIERGNKVIADEKEERREGRSQSRNESRAPSWVESRGPSRSTSQMQSRAISRTSRAQSAEHQDADEEVRLDREPSPPPWNTRIRSRAGRSSRYHKDSDEEYEGEEKSEDGSQQWTRTRSGTRSREVSTSRTRTRSISRAPSRSRLRHSKSFG